MSAHRIIYLDDSIEIADLIRALRFSSFAISNTITPNAYVIRPNPAVLSKAQFATVTDIINKRRSKP